MTFFESKFQRLSVLTFLVSFLFAVFCFAEGPPPSADQNLNEISDVRRAMLAKLARKLSDKDGNPLSIVLVNPKDTTVSQIGSTVTETILNSLSHYGTLNLTQQNYPFSALTLEELRKAISSTKADLLVLPVLQNRSFDLYLYDKRTPYFIYAHSEPVPEIDQFHVSEEAAAKTTRILVRRTMYRYINDQYFELPREESSPVMKSELPRWLASNESLAELNKEMVSRWYAGVSIGGALSFGAARKLWNSNLIGAQLGFRPFGKFYLEAASTTFSYNAFMGNIKYMFVSKDTPLRLAFGTGVSYVTDRKVWNADQTQGIDGNALFQTDSLSFMFPIGDVLLNIETRVFIGLGTDAFILTVAPGVILQF